MPCSCRARVAHTRRPGPRLDALALEEPAVYLLEDIGCVPVSPARITLGEIVKFCPDSSRWALEQYLAQG
jgi:hypothetical protein